MQPQVQPLTSLDRRSITKTLCAVGTEKRKLSKVKTYSEEERGKKGVLGGSCNGRDCWLVYRTTLSGRTERG